MTDKFNFKGDFMNPKQETHSQSADLQGFKTYFFRKFFRSPTAIIGLIIIFTSIFIAIFAPLIAPYDPFEMSLARSHQPPSRAHPLGTDFFGRDIMSRIFFGARISLIMGITVVAIRASIGIILGLIAGYYRGWIESVIMRLTDAVIAFPGILLALAIMAFRGQGLFNVMIALSVVGWTGYARLVRSEVISLREREYITAAKALGMHDYRVIFAHILPNCLASLIVFATIGIAAPIISEAGLSFLGLGARSDEITWGFMLSTGRQYLRQAWWAVTFPGLAIMFVVLGFNLLGDGLRDALDPKLKR